jgi:phage baseplate assembly protein W
MLNNILDRNDILQIREKLLSNKSEEQSIAQRALINDFNQYDGAYLGGLTYPLKLNGRGGLSLSYNSDRIEQQIMEILETRIGERIYRKFFGMPDVLFESVSEDVISNLLRKQILESLPSFVNIELDIVLRATDEGTLVVAINYSLPETSTSNRLIYQVSI